MKAHILGIILVLVLSTACNGTIEIGLEHSPAVNTSAPAVASLPALPSLTPIPTNTIIPPIPTDLPASPTPRLPTETPLPTDLPTSHMVEIFLIAMEDNGQSGVQVGCGDSAIAVQVETPPTQAVLTAALTALLSVKDQYYGQSGLYNALYQSDLQVDSVNISNGTATVYLTGTLILGGECDNPRVQAQLEQTVLQFPSVNQADIFINGKPLKDALSLKG